MTAAADDPWGGKDPWQEGRQPIFRPRSGVWEVTTEHGTRQILDLDERAYLRIRGSESANGIRTDMKWQGLYDFASGLEGPTERGEIWTARPLRIWTTGDEWWTTTWVTAVRELADDDVPPPSPIYLTRHWSDYLVSGGGIAVRGEGSTIEEAVSDYVAGLEAWLGGPGPKRSPRLARRYKSYADSMGSLRPWVALALADDIDRERRNEDARSNPPEADF